jgi:hypothetical protein
LSGLLKKAQGVREDYYNRGMIMRLQQDLSPMVLSFEIENILNGTDDILLQREDQVIIQTVLQMKEKQNLQIFGEVRMPGEYDYAANMSIKDLIVRAGGFNEAASGSFIEVARRHNIEESGFVRDELVKLYQFNIDRNLVVDEKSDTFKLEPFDYVYVRRAPSYHGQRTVYIVGEVRYPGAYSIGSKNEACIRPCQACWRLDAQCLHQRCQHEAHQRTGRTKNGCIAGYFGRFAAGEGRKPDQQLAVGTAP